MSGHRMWNAGLFGAAALGLIVASTGASALGDPDTERWSRIAVSPGSVQAVGRMTKVASIGSDTLMELARENRFGFVEVRAANPGLDPYFPGNGTDVVLPGLHLLPAVEPEGIVVNIGEMRLYHFREPGAEPDTYPIGIGREGFDTPLGETRVTRVKDGPTWYPTPRMRREDPTLPSAVPPGPDNPLGSHAIYLGWPAYLIHGTNEPFGVGRRVSSGCIRMYPEDIERLFGNVRPGIPVTVVDQPIKIGWVDGNLYLEAHPSRAQADQVETGVVAPFEIQEGLQKALLEEMDGRANKLDWRRIRQALIERNGVPIRVSLR